MKRLLVVLFGVLVFQGSVWAQCPDAKVLSPGANSVLIKDLPFVLQWQDDDLCLGKQVTIDLVDDKGKSSRIAYMKNKKDYKVKHPNSGFLNIDRLIAPESDHKYRFKISPAKKAQGQESIESEPIVVRLSNSFQKKGGALGSRSDASIPYQIGDLLTRIAALEATVKALEGGDGDGGETNGEGGMRFSDIVQLQVYYLERVRVAEVPSTEHAHTFSVSPVRLYTLEDPNYLGAVVDSGEVERSEGRYDLGQHTHGVQIKNNDGDVVAWSYTMARLNPALYHTHPVALNNDGKWIKQ